VRTQEGIQVRKTNGEPIWSTPNIQQQSATTDKQAPLDIKTQSHHPSAGEKADEKKPPEGGFFGFDIGSWQ